MMDLYILDKDRKPMRASPGEWSKFMGGGISRVALDEIMVGDESVRVSTVFLGADHNFLGGPPLLFETMVFRDGPEEQERYCTWEEALIGHQKMLEYAKKEKPQ